MGSSVFGVAVDCANAAMLAEFWSCVLGRPVADGATIDTAVVPADDGPAHGPRLGFHPRSGTEKQQKPSSPRPDYQRF